MDKIEQLREFHIAFGHYISTVPTIPSNELMEFRLKLIDEEWNELITAATQEDINNIAKELADLLYVAYGMAVTYGIDIDKVFDKVHENNMTKVGPDGKILRRRDGKIIKPENYIPIDLETILE